MLIEELNESILKLVQKHALASAEFSETLLANAIRQMLLAGDFTRYVLRHGNAEGIVYVPYQEKLKLLGRICELETRIAELEKSGISSAALGASAKSS